MSTEEVRIEQEELESIKKSVLTSSRRILVDAIDPANHTSYLRSKFVLSERDAEEINAPSSRSARAEVFLDKLSRKGSVAYDEFQNSLCRDRTQLFLLTSMTKTLELLKHKVKEFKVQQQLQRQKEQQELQKMKILQPSHLIHHQQRTCYSQIPQQKTSYSPPPLSNTSRVQHRLSPMTTTTTHSNTSQQIHQKQMYCQPSTAIQHQQRASYCQNRIEDNNILYQHQRRVNYGGHPQTHNNYSYHPSSQNHHHHQQQLNSTGFTSPPCYTTHPLTPSHTPPPPSSHHYQLPHSTHTRVPTFQSRDPTDNSATDDYHFTDELFPQGPPHELPLPLDTPCGQPCGQPS